MKNAFAALREEMVSRQILSRGIDDSSLLEAFRNIPRHFFVPEDQKKFVYNDCPLPIGWGQTISQPYIVALMTLHLSLSKGTLVLEVGTGSGYQAAILAFLGARVYTIERFSPLAKEAKRVLDSLGMKIRIREGDGTLGWSEHAPYERIIVTAGTSKIPPLLIEQLKVGGKMVIPLGQRFRQELTVVEKISETEIKEERVCGCMFVPLVGEYGWS